MRYWRAPEAGERPRGARSCYSWLLCNFTGCGRPARVAATPSRITDQPIWHALVIGIGLGAHPRDDRLSSTVRPIMAAMSYIHAQIWWCAVLSPDNSASSILHLGHPEETAASPCSHSSSHYVPCQIRGYIWLFSFFLYPVVAFSVSTPPPSWRNWRSAQANG